MDKAIIELLPTKNDKPLLKILARRGDILIVATAKKQPDGTQSMEVAITDALKDVEVGQSLFLNADGSVEANAVANAKEEKGNSRSRTCNTPLKYNAL